jgi:hypothetical protein
MPSNMYGSYYLDCAERERESTIRRIAMAGLLSSDELLLTPVDFEPSVSSRGQRPTRAA